MLLSRVFFAGDLSARALRSLKWNEARSVIANEVMRSSLVYENRDRLADCRADYCIGRFQTLNCIPSRAYAVQL